jgi:hypothetical protein
VTPAAWSGTTKGWKRGIFRIGIRAPEGRLLAMRSKNSRMEAILGNEKGAVAIIVALSLVALMMATALVVDVGSLYQERRFLQTVADSAALAGAQELPEFPDLARQTAIEYAARHEVSITPNDVEISRTWVSNDTITVTPVNPNAPLYFARVLGMDSVPIQARAKAIIASPKEYGGVVPWGIPWQDWVPGKPYVLKHGGGGGVRGNFGALALGHERGARAYEQNIIRGARTPLKVGDVVWTEPGNMRGPTEDGASERVAMGPNAGMQKFGDLADWDGKGYRLRQPDSQFVMVPLTTPLTELKGGRSEVTILGFAPFIITGIKKGEVEGTFLHEALIVNTGPIGALQPGGIRVIRLIE